MRRVTVVRTYLALDDRSQFNAKQVKPGMSGTIIRRAPCPVDVYRRLYREVGEQWYWHDRLEWSDESLAEHLSRPDVGVWEMTVGQDSAGYFELQRHDDGSLEVAYFGLTPAYIGQGLGGRMLQRAVDEAWALGANRIWLHTCTLDSARALPNYMKCGFQPYKTERLEVEIEGKEVVSERMLG
ncbi:MAG: GNAT family N-acetyltransferase [Gemmatimonadaceae bacterium]